MTKEEILGLKEGDLLELCIDTRDRQPLPGARWCEARPVGEVTLRGTSSTGKAYALFYRRMPSGALVSGAVAEGDGHYRLAVPAVELAACSGAR